MGVVIFLLVLVVAAGSAAGVRYLYDNGSDALPNEEGQEEPIGAKPAVPPERFVSGKTSAGDTWYAESYRSRDGRTCIDVAITAAGLPGSGTGGGCFRPADGGPLWGVVSVKSDQSVVYGLGTPGGSVEVTFSSSEKATTTSDASGRFAVAGRGQPVAVEHRQ